MPARAQERAIMALPAGNIDATDPGTILSFDGSGFDATRVISPTVVWDGSRYVMLYAGLPFGNNFQIGLATSVDGTTWTPHSSDPVISNAASQPWGAFREIPVSAVYENGTYKLWFYGDNSNLSGDPGFGSGFGLATSTDAINWTWNPGNPIRWEINAPQGNGFNLTEVVKLGGQYHAYFTDQDPAGDVLKHAVSADGITFSGDAQLTLPTGYQLRAATTARDGNTEYVLAVLESGGVQHYGTSLDGVNFTIQGTTDLPSAFGTGEILVKDGQVHFFGTVGVGNVNWNFGNAVIQSATAPLEPATLPFVEGSLLAEAGLLARDAYLSPFDAVPYERPIDRNWIALTPDDLAVPASGAGFSFGNGLYAASVPGTDFNTAAYAYIGNLDGKITIALAFRGSDEPGEVRAEIQAAASGQATEYFNNYYNQTATFVTSVADAAINGLTAYGQVDQLLVTGFSLGGILAESFAARVTDQQSELSEKSAIFTFGSPGSPDFAQGGQIINFGHDDDPISIGSALSPALDPEGASVLVERPEAGGRLRGLLTAEHDRALYADTAVAISNFLEIDAGRFGLSELSLSQVASEYRFGVGTNSFDRRLLVDRLGVDRNQKDIVLGLDGGGTLDGRLGADILVGGSGIDDIHGGRGLDGLLGLGGNDNLYGDVGTEDTAFYRGNANDFEISALPRARSWSVIDRYAEDGDEGSDTLRGVEFLQFGDGQRISLLGETPAAVVVPADWNWA